MAGGIDFTMGFHTHGAARKISEGEGYRIYILGNFSGQPSQPWEQRPFRKIDIDTLEAVMAQISPTLALGSGAELSFDNPDAFEPDIWLHKVTLLADLHALKVQLGNPQTAARAAAKIQAFFPDSQQPPIQSQASGESQEQMLERLLGKKPDVPPTANDGIEQWIKNMVAPHVSPAADPQYQGLIGVIDSTISQFVKTLLHSPDFQNLEALWLATAALVNEAAADESRVFLIDIQQQELAAALQDPAQAFSQKLIRHCQTGDGEQDVLLVGAYPFGDSDPDQALLQACGQLAEGCGAYFLGGVDQGFIQNRINASPERWAQFRLTPVAERLILSYPRVLLRMPYGAKRRPQDSFTFEECAEIPRSHELLWGSSAFLCARTLMRTALDPDTPDPGFFDEVPAFSYLQDGEPMLQAGVETLLNEKQANALWSQGIMPAIGFRQRQGVRLLGASPVAA